MPENPKTNAVSDGTRWLQCGQPRQVYTTHILLDASTTPERSDTVAKEHAWRVRFNLRNRNRRMGEHRYEAVLELTVSCGCEQYLVYRTEVHQAGIFDLSAIPEADRSRVLNTDCPRALFPLAVRVSDKLVRDAGFPPFQLPSINFEDIYAQKRGKVTSPDPRLQLREFWDAVVHLQQAGRALPRHAGFRAIHAESLAVAQLSRDALPAADQVLAQSPHDLATLEMLSAAYSMNNAHLRAVDVYRLMVSAQPGNARAHYNLATSLMFTGDLSGAEREITTCIECQPTFWDAYSVLSKVRRQSAEDNHVDALQALLKQFGDQPQARERLNMALAKEYEDLGDYTRAFEHMAEGNKVGKARRRYDIRQDEALFDSLMQSEPGARPQVPRCDSAEPIFVFGMPRSGTTLVDRILSSHPQVTSAGELKQFGMLLKCMSQSTTEDLIDTDTVARSRDLDWRALGAGYLGNTRPLTGRTAHFVDKFTHHFLYVRYLASALPNSKMICVRRNPMDTCLANFRQVFSESSPFHGYACDLLDAGHYFVLFDRLMAHWQRVFPGRILEVPYESLVDDQEGNTRNLLEFCGLPWDPACLAYEKNRAPVSTASAVQVRSPIYRGALQRWTHYAGQLAPLRDLFVHAGVALPSS